MKRETAIRYAITVYKILFVVLMLLSAVPFIHQVISPYIRYILVPGLLFAAYDFFLGKRKLWKTKYLLLLALFAVCYMVTVVLNRELHFSENVKALLYMGVIFLTLYGYNPGTSIEEKEKEMKAVYLTIVIGTFILSAVCLFTYLFSWNMKYMNGETAMYIGMYDNRLWGIYNPNTGSTLNVLSIMSSLMLFEKIKRAKILGRILLGVNLIVQVPALVLTHSRAPIFIGIFGVAAYLVFVFLKHEKKRKGTKRYRRGILLGGVALLLMISSENLIRTGLSYLPPMLKETSISGIHIQETGKKENVDKKKVNTQKKDKAKKSVQKRKERVDLTRKEKEEERAGGILTGRGDLWQAGIRGFLDKPLFGTSRENLYVNCEPYLQDDIWQSSLDVGGLHNIYLTVLVSSGAVGFIVLAVFVFCSLRKILPYAFLKKGLENNVFFRGSFLILIQFAGMEMMEARILYRVGIFYVLFFMIYGYAMYYTQKEEQEEKVIHAGNISDRTSL